eukprot:43602-Eustigmatos_ZCMA.PRE.1
MDLCLQSTTVRAHPFTSDIRRGRPSVAPGDGVPVTGHVERGGHGEGLARTRGLDDARRRVHPPVAAALVVALRGRGGESGGSDADRVATCRG